MVITTKLERKLGRAAESFLERLSGQTRCFAVSFSVSTCFGMYGESPLGGSSSSFHFFAAFVGFSSYTGHSSWLKNLVP
jgi:hypothetical protein